MFEIQERNGFNIVHLTDGNLLTEAVGVVEKGKADGININFIKNWRADLEPLRNSKSMKCLIVNDYPPSIQYNYTAIHSLPNLLHLSVYTSDKKEIDFTAFQHLNSVTLTWRLKAKSLFKCHHLQHFFLGSYNGKDLSNLTGLKNLKCLRINLGSVVSLNGLGELSGLEKLMLMQVTKLEDIEDILELKKLQYLRIDNCKRVKNIDAINRMNISDLEITGTTPNK
jgi:hypothetical protein